MSPSPRTSSSSTCPHRAADHCGIDIPGFSTLAPSVQVEKEEAPAPVSSRAKNGTWAARVCSPRTPHSTTPSTTLSTNRGSTAPADEEPMPELPNLTPQAARAIAAAAQAHTEAERDAALAMATGPNDEPLDRDLLLRFLSSVKR